MEGVGLSEAAVEALEAVMVEALEDFQVVAVIVVGVVLVEAGN